MRLAAMARGSRRCFTKIARLGRHFVDARLFLERFFARARPIEVQIFGTVRHVIPSAERDCSLQAAQYKWSRNACARSSDAMRKRLRESAIALGTRLIRIGGTVDFLYD